MANNVKLLVVEDNPMVLRMLQQALAPLAQVSTATDAADALLKAVDDPPACGKIAESACDRQFLDGADGQQSRHR